MRFRPILLSLTVFPLLTGAAFGQTPPPPATEAPTTTLKVTARNVLVDVVVSDKRDQPVSGLQKEDFQIFEDGKPQTITFFEPSFAETQATALTASAAPLPPNTFTNVPTVAPNNSVNVLLMDAMNTAMGDQSYLHKEMVSYLASIPPGTRIGIFLLGEKLRIIQGITQDSTLLRASIARLASNPSKSALLPTIAETDAENVLPNLILEEAAQTNSTQLQDTAAALQQFLSQQANFEANERAIMTMEALQQIARYLSGVPGRKNLIWFVGSFPACLAGDTNDIVHNGCPYVETYKKTVDALADARVSIYPIDARGMSTNGMHVAENSQLPGMPTNPQQVIAAQSKSLHADLYNDSVNQGQMEDLAKNTGGKATYNSNDFKGVLTADIDNGSRYYTLAYTPTNTKQQGKERKIEIKAASGNYKLSYRRSYFEDTPKELKAAESASAKDPLRPLMDRGMPAFSELRYRETVKPAASQPAADAPRAGDNAALKAPVTRYTVNFALSTDGLTLVPGPDGVRHATIEVALVAYSQQGTPLNWEVRYFGLAIRPEQNAIAETSGIPFHFDFDMPPGDVYLRTGIYQAATSKAGTLEVPLTSIAAAGQ